ncbi:MAG: hypothetical protein ACOX1V_02620 [Candidatus Iainarchaeum sp.]
MPPKKRMSYEASPGELYRGISTSLEEFEGEKKIGVEKEHDFVIFCKKLARQYPGLGKGAVYSEQHKEAVQFLGWRLTAEEFMSAVKGIFVSGLIPAILILVLTYFAGFYIPIGDGIGMGMLVDAFDDTAYMLFFGLALALFGGISFFAYIIYSYPINAAEDEKNRALSYVPEMVGYLIMSMKLVPNLEKAIEFSAKHGKGKVADEFNRLIWDFQIGIYSSISEGLDLMALRWSKYSSELKESLMKIRASVMEPSEAKRYQLLDKTMSEVLESVKDKMGDYARSLNQPSVMLFYIGVLLPLLLVIILPIGSAFSSTPFATTPVLVMIYCVLIPMFAFNFAKGVIKKRPATYEPPFISDNFAGLPPKWGARINNSVVDVRLICIGILVVGFVLSFFLSVEGLPPKSLFLNSEVPFQIIPADKQLDEVYAEKVIRGVSSGKNYYEKVGLDLYAIQINHEFFGGGIKEGDYYNLLVNQGVDPKIAEQRVFKEKLEFTSSAQNDTTKYIFWSGVIFTIVLAFSVGLYYRNIYKRKAQEQIIQMEDEFKESMYMIASRMGENKPVENALKQARDFLPNLLVSRRIFAKTVENIELMGLPLENAVFDPVYGAMKGIPSKLLSTSMRLLVDSVDLGVEVASRTLMSLSLQMENMDKVNKSLQEMVSDVTTTMSTMALFIAPMVLGITTALQKVVIMTLASVVTSPEVDMDTIGSTASNLGGGSFNMQSLFKVNFETFRSFATPLEYMIIVGIYVALIVVILTYFTSKIKEDNDLVYKLNLAKGLPIAIAVYLITTIAANLAISTIMFGGA